MDRNLIFAIALCYLVLVVYQSVFIKPVDPKKHQITQTTVNKEDVINNASNLSISPDKSDYTTSTAIVSKKSYLKTSSNKYEFNNVGGVLHNIEFVGSKDIMPIDNILSIDKFTNKAYDIIEENSSRIVYVYSDKMINITKQYELKDKTINATIKIINKQNDSSLEDLSINLINFNHNKISEKSSRNTMLDEVSILEGKKVFRKNVGNKFSDKDNRVQKGSAAWFGFRDHFHCLIIKPEFETKQYENQRVSENDLSVKATVTISNGKEYAFTIVAANQDIGYLNSIDKEFGRIVAFFNWSIFDFFGKGIYYLVPAIQYICRSWGLAIILVSLIIYGVTYPLTKQSMASMKKMQLVQPKIAALQKKYKADPQKLNSEMIDLYKREGVNPLGGCLPFLLQMPIFIALYQVLWRAYYFQGKSFLWIKDLSLPDKLFVLPFSIPFIGSDFNILPILMGIVMFIQQLVSSKNMVVVDEAQAMQQKMMKYFFPVFIMVIFYKFASGLSLYFTVFYALSAWTQWRVSKSK